MACRWRRWIGLGMQLPFALTSVFLQVERFVTKVVTN